MCALDPETCGEGVSTPEPPAGAYFPAVLQDPTTHNRRDKHPSIQLQLTL